MQRFTSLKNIDFEGLSFTIRDNTSDFKAIKEVVIDKSYQRKNFRPESGDKWIDIGANCGAFCVWAGRLGAIVEAFEPDYENASIAEVNVQQNGLSKIVKVHQLGLTEDENKKEAILYRNTANGNLWRNSIYKSWRGGEKIKVSLVPAKKYWVEGNCVKLDAEGLEMPLLEKYAEIKLKKLVFEWSFDIDNSIQRFEKIIERLGKVYPNIIYSGYAQGHKVWQPSWFPACRTVWCF
jgi:FkbM family methyltransferase